MLVRPSLLTKEKTNLSRWQHVDVLNRHSYLSRRWWYDNSISILFLFLLAFHHWLY